MYRTLLVPLDGSTFGEQALPLALSIARRAKADLQVVHVHNPLAGLYPGEAVYVDDTLEAHLRNSQRAYLESVVRRVSAVSAVHVTPVFLEGGIVESLQVQAKSTEIDLVVMTTHGRGPLGRFWMGSVADQLVRELPMPLLLVRPQDAPLDLKKEPTFHHALLPLDGSALAEQMIEPAIALGSLMDADYTLLRVIKPPTPVNLNPEVAGLGGMAQSVIQQIDKLQEQLQREAEAYLEEVAQRLRKRSLRVQTRVAVEDQPAVAVLHEAESSAMDLIALETHGRRGLARMFLGSVADKVIRGGSVPVLVHRPVYQ